jgi:hypothetical protein
MHSLVNRRSRPIRADSQHEWSEPRRGAQSPGIGTVRRRPDPQRATDTKVPTGASHHGGSHNRRGNGSKSSLRECRSTDPASTHPSRTAPQALGRDRVSPLAGRDVAHRTTLSVDRADLWVGSYIVKPSELSDIVQRHNRFYVVAYDGLDPLTGRRGPRLDGWVLGDVGQPDRIEARRDALALDLARPRCGTELTAGSCRASGTNRASRTGRTYCRAMAIRRRSSGSMKWSWSSAPRSIWTQWILPVKRLLRVV